MMKKITNEKHYLTPFCDVVYVEKQSLICDSTAVSVSNNSLTEGDEILFD